MFSILVQYWRAILPWFNLTAVRHRKSARKWRGRVLWVKMKIEHQRMLLSWYSVADISIIYAVADYFMKYSTDCSTRATSSNNLSHIHMHKHTYTYAHEHNCTQAVIVGITATGEFWKITEHLRQMDSVMDKAYMSFLKNQTFPGQNMFHLRHDNWIICVQYFWSQAR